jgi:ribosomal protein L25 (general stress protein Ctc)
MNQVSLVEQLKEVLKAQNASLRLKHDELKALREENSRLTGLVGELEIENEGLKGLLSTYQTDSAAGATEKGPIDNGTLRPR